MHFRLTHCEGIIQAIHASQFGFRTNPGRQGPRSLLNQWYMTTRTDMLQKQAVDSSSGVGELIVLLSANLAHQPKDKLKNFINHTGKNDLGDPKSREERRRRAADFVCELPPKKSPHAKEKLVVARTLVPCLDCTRTLASWFGSPRVGLEGG